MCLYLTGEAHTTFIFAIMQMLYVVGLNYFIYDTIITIGVSLFNKIGHINKYYDRDYKKYSCIRSTQKNITADN